MEIESQLFDQFIRRFSYGKNIKKVDSFGAHGGSPHYFYCGYCGIPTEAFPEQPAFAPSECCTQCRALLDRDILEEASRAARAFFVLDEEQ